jgi:uncharacterized protein with HEPN domain
MSDKSVRLRDYLGHILQAIERIERYTADMTEAAFATSRSSAKPVVTSNDIVPSFPVRIRICRW